MKHSDADWSVLLAEQARANSALFYSLAFKVLRERSAAEDACQKAMLTAWVRRDEIVDRGQLKGWLATAIINESLAVLRRQKVEKKVVKLVALHGGESTGGMSPDSDARRDAIVLALGQLQDHERAAVTLRVMHGLSGKDVAALLGVSDGQVSKLLHRGMEILRTTLAMWDNNNG
jgi:RNA polymerase sigma-70 factor (ECF subfamily)